MPSAPKRREILLLDRRDAVFLAAALGMPIEGDLHVSLKSFHAPFGSAFETLPNACGLLSGVYVDAGEKARAAWVSPRDMLSGPARPVALRILGRAWRTAIPALARGAVGLAPDFDWRERVATSLFCTSALLFSHFSRHPSAPSLLDAITSTGSSPIGAPIRPDGPPRCFCAFARPFSFLFFFQGPFSWPLSKG